VIAIDLLSSNLDEMEIFVAIETASFHARLRP